MKIILFGYGKMGQTIEKIAQERGHQIKYIINSKNDRYNIREAEMAIDFSTPIAAFQNITMCLNSGLPIVCGTTGWLEKYDDIINLCNKKKGAFLYSSNFSLGANVFFELNKRLAALMKNHRHYKLSIKEIHHKEKKDSPSGTAIKLANDLIKESNYENWKLGITTNKKTINIESSRKQKIAGTHRIIYESDIDSIKIEHNAKNRLGFAMGAILSAEWLLGKTGIFSINDVINIK